MKCFIIIFLLFLLLGILGLIYASFEARMLEVKYIEFTRSTTRKNDTSIINNTQKITQTNSSSFESKSANTLRILFFSDIHVPDCFIKSTRITELINSTDSIDAVIFGGDISNHGKRSDLGVKYINEIAAICESNNIPFLGVTGNHDVEFPKEDLAKCRFINLSNSSYEINNFVIRGLHDSGRHPRVWYDSPFETSSDKTNVLICHNPDWLLYGASKAQLDYIDYMISGHVHGGQLRLPFSIENKVFRKDALPRRDVVKGSFDGAGVSFYISRGLGCVLVPFRFLSKPEVTLIDIPQNF